MFRSARFKLTLFYLAAVLAVSLTMSLGTRWLAQHEYEHSNVVQRGAFRGIVTRIYGLQWQEDRPDVFAFQRLQEDQVRAKLNLYVFWINFGALVLGGLGSYWFAGRTLRPIEEAHDAQKRFASDASHELRTPLTAIKTENEVFLRQKDFTKDDAKDLIKSNLEEVDRLERLATNLLSLTEFENASLKLVKLPVTEVIEEAVALVRRTHSNATFDMAVVPQLVWGEKTSLVQLVHILLDNACKYGPSGKPVTITGELRDGGYKLTVSDKGKGIAAEDLPHIFDRLYRGDKARSSQISGHGLGLALAKRIAAANRATITAANAPKGGAVFTVGLATKSVSL